MNICRNCGKQTKNPKYCSRTCAVTITNRTPKRKRTRYPYNCQSCGEPISGRRKYCKDRKCSSNYVDWEKVTIGELRGKRKYQIHSRVRDLSRKAYLRSSKPKECLVCGHSRYFEVCHIRSISDFPDRTLITEVNDLSNLVALCRNHHWEFDNGLLQLEEHDRAVSPLPYKQ